MHVNVYFLPHDSLNDDTAGIPISRLSFVRVHVCVLSLYVQMRGYGIKRLLGIDSLLKQFCVE